MRLLCFLLFAAAYCSFFFSAQHVPGVNYLIGDVVSLGLTGIQASGSEYSALPDSDSFRSVGRLDISTFQQRRYSFWTHGIAPFLPQPKKTPFFSAISLASCTLPGLCAQQMSGHSLFATFLARNVQHFSIKVCLSGVRAFHIDQGFSYLLADCLGLERVVCGIKC